MLAVLLCLTPCLGFTAGTMWRRGAVALALVCALSSLGACAALPLPWAGWSLAGEASFTAPNSATEEAAGFLLRQHELVEQYQVQLNAAQAALDRQRLLLAEWRTSLGELAERAQRAPPTAAPSVAHQTWQLGASLLQSARLRLADTAQAAQRSLRSAAQAWQPWEAQLASGAAAAWHKAEQALERPDLGKVRRGMVAAWQRATSGLEASASAAAAFVRAHIGADPAHPVNPATLGPVDTGVPGDPPAAPPAAASTAPAPPAAEHRAVVAADEGADVPNATTLAQVPARIAEAPSQARVAGTERWADALRSQLPVALHPMLEPTQQNRTSAAAQGLGFGRSTVASVASAPPPYNVSLSEEITCLAGGSAGSAAWVQGRGVALYKQAAGATEPMGIWVVATSAAAHASLRQYLSAACEATGAMPAHAAALWAHASSGMRRAAAAASRAASHLLPAASLGSALLGGVWALALVLLLAAAAAAAVGGARWALPRVMAAVAARLRRRFGNTCRCAPGCFACLGLHVRFCHACCKFEGFVGLQPFGTILKADRFASMHAWSWQLHIL